MAEVGSAFVSILPSAKGFGSNLSKQVDGDISKAGKTTGGKFGSALKVGALAALGGAVIVGKFLSGALDEAREAQVIGARTENVIKKMGDAAGISAKQVGDLAGAISLKTGVDDEAIQAGQNLLLTFGNIRNEAGKGNDIFSQTSKLMVDMSAAMGTDAKGSAIQLGKALNDPVKGLSALSRVGVSFTEQQAKQITAMTESGNILGAQKVILGELERQFGGAAAAMATPGDKVAVAWGNVKEQIGTALLPVLDKFLNLVLGAMPTVTKLIAGVGPAFASVKAFIAPVVATVKELFASFSGGGGGAALTKVADLFRTVFGNIKTIVADAVSIAMSLWRSFGGTFTSLTQGTFKNLITVIRGAFNVVAGIFKTVAALLRGDWKGAWEGIKQILRGAWDVIKGVVKQGWATIKAMFSAAGTVIKGVFGRIWDGIKTLALKGIDAVVEAVAGLPDRLRGLAGTFLNAGKALIGAFVDGMKNAAGIVSGIAGNVWDSVRSLLNSAIAKLNTALSFSISIPGPDINFNANIPSLASGGIATRSTLAEIGEGRESEAVLPLSKLSGMLDRERAAGAAAGGGSGRQALTITNWDEGIGYLETVADDRVHGARELNDQKMRALL